MKRGEVWWAELAPPAGRRPLLLLSRDEAYVVRRLITVAPITTRIRGIASEVRLGTADGMFRECAISLDTITTIPKDALRRRIVALTRQKVKAVEEALKFALGME